MKYRDRNILEPMLLAKD